MSERQVTSQEFRRVYAKLTEPVTVTVLGRPIAHYVPISAAIDARALAGERPGEPATPRPASSAIPAAPPRESGAEPAEREPSGPTRAPRKSVGSVLERAAKAGRSK